MLTVEDIQNKAKKLIPVVGNPGHFIIDPPIRVKSVYCGQAFYAIQIDISIPQRPLLYMAETRSWRHIVGFVID